ncbi:MAG: hypothetical protein P8X74_06895 [Reinekea sp.]
MDSKFKWLIVLIAAFALAACDPADETTDDGNGSDNSTTDTTTTTTLTGAVIALGAGSGDSFSSGNISANITSLSAGGSTSLTVNIVDTSSSNDLFTGESVEVTFSSTCVSAGKASFSIATVATSSGSASTTYTAEGCVGSDVVVANVDSTSARVTLTVAPSDVNAISFTGSGFLSSIAYSNSGNSSQASFTRVEFQLIDKYGFAVEGQPVSFAISSSDSNHGAVLSVTSDVSDESGLVDVLLNAGSAPANVKVIATFTPTTGDPISTQSLPIAVNTGPVDANSFNFAVSEASVASAFSEDGKTASITARLADRNNNPVADGTVVSFWTEYGYIEPTCETSSGTCSVTWTSSGMRPLDGLSTILAYTVGEDAFIDAGAKNGIYDIDEAIITQSEVFYDLDFDGTYDSSSFTDAGSGLGVNSEAYLDYNNSKAFEASSTTYRGALCSSAAAQANHCAETSVHVWDTAQLALNTNIPQLNSSLGTWGLGSHPLAISDSNGNFPPFGTTVTLAAQSSTTDVDFSILGVVPKLGSSGAGSYTFSVVVNEITVPGDFNVVVTLPGGSDTIVGTVAIQ